MNQDHIMEKDIQTGFHVYFLYKMKYNIHNGKKIPERKIHRSGICIVLRTALQ